MISVIVAVKDEEAVLAEGLSRLCTGADPAELELVVVCNGCTDGSADVARGIDFPVRVVETSVASKTHAWNLGDEAASHFPRFYVDADVHLAWPAVRATAALLEAGPALAAAPAIEVDLAGARWPVRAFYRVWLELPYIRTHMIGSGVFALSEAGRRRFGAFPDVIGDDEFVRCRFRVEERHTVPDCRFTVFAPRTLRDLVRIKARSRLGRLQLEARGLAGDPGDDPRRYRAHVLAQARSPARWPSLLAYAAIVLCVRALARRRARAGDFGGWQRDESSRRNRSRAAG